MNKEHKINPLEAMLGNLAIILQNDHVDACLVGYDPRVGVAGAMIVGCPECSNYSEIARLLRNMADDLDNKAMEEAPCAKHVRKN